MKSFHITGNCVPTKHYMVDTNPKLDQIMKMIDRGEYFVINRPRQYGKTTTLFLLQQRLFDSETYFPIKMSFEGFDDSQFETSKVFCYSFLLGLGHDSNIEKLGYSALFLDKMKDIDTFQELSIVLKSILSKIPKKVVLLIDEVDKSSNNELFLHFLGMLRDKYLNASNDLDVTFSSVILAGVNDIKSLKQRIRPESATQLNSPWNIAAEFDVDMSFNPSEIETMLIDYVAETGVQMDTKAIGERIHFWTSGYPFLVSILCKRVAEKILPTQQCYIWEIRHIDEAVRLLKYEKTTLFEVIIKNLENNPDLYKLIESIVLGCVDHSFVWQNPLLDMAYMHGIITRNEDGKARIHNKIFNEVIVDYFISKNKTRLLLDPISNIQNPYKKADGKLDLEKVLLSFQEVVKQKYSNNLLKKTDDFIEKDLRLLFLVYLQPIINGIGKSFMEVEIGGEKRLDIIISYLDELFVVELKIWDGIAYHNEGKQRLKHYMQAMNIDKGYMLIMYKTKQKTFKNEIEDGIFMVYI